jgi:hypothetical protein
MKAGGKQSSASHLLCWFLQNVIWLLIVMSHIWTCSYLVLIVLFSVVFGIKSFEVLFPVIDLKNPRCLLLLQLLRIYLTGLSEMLCACSSLVNDVSDLLHFCNSWQAHCLTCHVLPSTLVIPCVLPLSQGIAALLKLVLHYLKGFKVQYDCCNCSYFCSPNFMFSMMHTLMTYTSASSTV